MNTVGELRTGPSSRATLAVERALDERHREATDEVEKILAAAVAVMQRVAPEPPRVNDIVAEAGISKKSFYRYFSGKDDLLLAVMERGIGIVVSYLDHRMAKADNPTAKIACWVQGALAQVSDPHLISMSRAVVEQMSTQSATDAVTDIMAPLRTQLLDPVTALGSTDPRRDAQAIFELTIATMRRYVGAHVQPEQADIDHLVRFCLRGLTIREDTV